MKNIVKIDEIPWLVSPPPEKPPRRIKFLIGNDAVGSENVALLLVMFEPGVKSSLHSHRKSETMWFILSGKAHVRLGDETFEVGPRNVVYIPKGAKHKIENADTENLEFIEFISPPFTRADSTFGLEDIKQWRG